MNPNTIVCLLAIAYFLLFVLFCFFVKVKIWIRVVGGMLVVAVTMSVNIWIGHTEWNRLSQLQSNLNKLQAGGKRIEVSGKEYNVKGACYTGPLNWTPFQMWTVLEIN